MFQVFQSAFLKALGWSLLDSLWQMGSLWLVYIALTRNGRKLNANQRHNLAFGALACGAVWFIFTIILHMGIGKPSASLPFVADAFMNSVSVVLDPLLPVFSSAYLIMTLVLMIKLYRQYRYTLIISTHGLKKAAPEIRVFLQQLAPSMGIKKEVNVYLSSLVETPLTIGFWKPVILLPVALVTNLSIKQTESLILHELYHIQRNDFLLNLLLAFADVLLFFNPFARALKEVIQQEREHRCDDIVLQFRYDPASYAEALLILEKQRPERESVGLAATGNKKLLLLARVKRLLTGETMASPVSQRLLAVFTSAIFLAFWGIYEPGRALVQEPVSRTEFASQSYDGYQQRAAGETPAPFETDVDQSAEGSPPTEEINEPVPALAKDGASEIDLEASVADILVSEKIGELLLVNIEEPVPAYIKEEKPSEYTIRFDGSSTPSETSPGTMDYPYVPSKSFEFFQADSTSRSSAALLKSDLQAKYQADLDALFRDSNFTWRDIEQEVATAAAEVNSKRVEHEVEKRLAEIDWKKLNANRKAALSQAQLIVIKSKLEIARVNREKQARMQLEISKRDSSTNQQSAPVIKPGVKLKTKKIVTI